MVEAAQTQTEKFEIYDNLHIQNSNEGAEKVSNAAFVTCDLLDDNPERHSSGDAIHGW